MIPETVTISTPDGACPAFVYTPQNGATSWPAVIFFMDGIGMRPVMHEMARRLADGGYLVLLPDLYYRSGPYAPMDPAVVFNDPEKKAVLMGLIKSLNRERKIVDARAFAGFLASRGDVRGTRFGCTGYCLGGNVAMTAAGALKDRFAAAASFHGGNLASDDPDSPHRFLDGVTATVYVGGAIEDSSFPDEQKERLERALTAAGVPHTVTTYQAHHGFAVPDHPAYDAAAAQRHWDALFALLDAELGTL